MRYGEADMRFLLIIDMQEDYTGEKRNKKKFPYDIESLIYNINHKIDSYSKEYVVYIKNQFFWEPKKREKLLSKGMNVISDQIFTKRNTNSFKNIKFANFLKEKNVTELEIIGIDGNYCVKKTAIAALKIGYEVFLNESCIGIADTKKYEKSKMKMKKMGIKFL